MFKKQNPKQLDIPKYIFQFPHCDQRVLHAPGECVLCDAHPLWQTLRQAWGIAFTGYTPEYAELPYPADHARGATHQLWQGNQPKEGVRGEEC